MAGPRGRDSPGRSRSIEIGAVCFRHSLWDRLGYRSSLEGRERAGGNGGAPPALRQAPHPTQPAVRRK